MSDPSTSLTWAKTSHGDVCLQGGHVTRWTGGGGDVLFMSRQSRFEPGQPIRGGVPVIFPWFGDDPDGRGRPAHGFARRLPWRLLDRTETALETRCALRLDDSDTTRAQWPHAFGLRLDVVFGDALTMTLTVENRDAAPFRCETALHTYLKVGEVRRIAIHGLEETTFLDKADGMRTKRETAQPIRLTGATDRVYLDTTSACRIVDPMGGRAITIDKDGSRSTILWNPWSEGAAAMSDLADDEWPTFVCVESANVHQNALTLAPGASHAMRVTIS
jgi:glucose-6-phosphate 1-epimerase